MLSNLNPNCLRAKVPRWDSLHLYSAASRHLAPYPLSKFETQPQLLRRKMRRPFCAQWELHREQADAQFICFWWCGLGMLVRTAGECLTLWIEATGYHWTEEVVKSLFGYLVLRMAPLTIPCKHLMWQPAVPKQVQCLKNASCAPSYCIVSKYSRY